MVRRAVSGGSASIHLPKAESESALKIQKAFLGFLVRKSFRKIVDCGRRVEEIQTRICQEESFDLIMNNEMERAKVNEALMSLILQLDSLDLFSGVRCCRKAIIEKAIALQEATDAIGAIDSDNADIHRQSPTIPVNASADDLAMTEDEAEPVAESSSKSQRSAASGELESIRKDVLSYQLTQKSTSHQELLEKMMDDNEKLMSVLQEVFEMNHLQAQSISFLTSRVEQLERARLDEKLRKIRKRRHEIEIVSSKH
uniref:BAG domain-containing protein n=1 Tax=Kalanchoe fedtschenkoi TaxID=63787 RepID=A0A7N0UUC5_KALFE